MPCYMTYIGKHLKEVRCKGCDALLLARRGIAQNLRIDRLPAYAELVLEMRNPDGQLSKHETAMCRACVTRLRTSPPKPGELEALYASDMEQHYASTIIAGHAPKEVERMLAKFADRVPLRVLDQPGRGETWI